MKELRARLTFANVMSLIALFIALGGSAYAATQLPKNSVGKAQLKKGAVTPAKLSAAAKSSMTGEPGGQGQKGDRGEPGPPGRQGEPGTTGGEPFVIDASGQLADVTAQSPAPIPLTGTTFWSSSSGQAGLLFGDVTATVSNSGGSIYFCTVQIQLFVDGTGVGAFSVGGSTPTPTEFSATLAPIPIAVHEPGVHTITATSTARPECIAGSRIDSLHLIVAPLGA